MKKHLIAIKGAGDLASGVALRLWRSGFPIIMTELEVPLCIRRTIAFSSAVFDGSAKVEDAEGILIDDVKSAESIWAKHAIPVIVDPDASKILSLHPDVLIDARLIKAYREDTHVSDAPLVIGMGPGFRAGVGGNVDCVIETMRGHNLGRVIHNGEAEPNTGVPGLIAGEGIRRVVKSPADGIFNPCCQIGDAVEVDDVIARIGDVEIKAQLAGIVRGIIYPGIEVWKGLKIMDIDPRGKREHCFTVSDKASALGGGVLEAILGRFDD